MLSKLLCGVSLVLSLSVMASPVYELVVPNPPGGVTDIVGRHVAKVLSENGISTLVQNKTGAQGTIGVKSVTTATNVQNTLLILGAGPGLYAPLMMTPSPYQVLDDLQIISTIASDHVVIIVPGNSEIKNLQQLIKLIKTNNLPLRYATGAVSLEFAEIMFLNKINAQAIEIVYNGAAPVVTSVAGNNVEFGIVTLTDAKEMAKSGRIRIIGIASDKRHPTSPDIKTFKEQGLEFEQKVWFTLVAHKNIDIASVYRLNAVLTNSLKTDTTSYVATEMTPIISSVAESRSFIENQYKLYRPIIQKALLERSIKKQK